MRIEHQNQQQYLSGAWGREVQRLGVRPLICGATARRKSQEQFSPPLQLFLNPIHTRPGLFRPCTSVLPLLDPPRPVLLGDSLRGVLLFFFLVIYWRWGAQVVRDGCHGPPRPYPVYSRREYEYSSTSRVGSEICTSRELTAGEGVGGRMLESQDSRFEGSPLIFRPNRSPDSSMRCWTFCRRSRTMRFSCRVCVSINLFCC